MLEWGMILMFKVLLKLGLCDMVCIFDVWMLGISFGVCVLYVLFEVFVGGLLVLLKIGDMVELDILVCSLNMLVLDVELVECCVVWQVLSLKYECGYGYIFSKYIEQVDKGCDFDFLKIEYGCLVDEFVIN